MKHLRIFKTETDYNSAVSEFEYPTVSLVQDVEDVRYMTLRDKYTREYLTFEALENGTFTLSIPANVNSTYITSVSYSTDDGENWTTTTVDDTAQTITTPTITQGNKVLWKGVCKQMAKSSSNNKFSYFSSTGNFNVSGNIMSLLYGDEFANQVTFTSGSTYNFAKLFVNSNKLISASNMILPATTLTDSCYYYMFNGCTSLTTAPELPATTMTNYCYCGMFKGCTSLTTAPVLPATTLANSCYSSMFEGCTALTTTPALPATTLATSCYSSMFYGTNILPDCTNIDFTSDTVVASGGLISLFAGTKVTNVDLYNILPINPNSDNYCLPITTLASACYDSMFRECTSLTTAPELPATTLATSCYSSMFYGCTSLTTAPELPATTLAERCYQIMFSGCTSLTTAPVLPATTLVSNCYIYMFDGCTALNNIKAMFTTTPSSGYLGFWVRNVAATGTFVKNSAATWNVTGNNGVPTGWTVETASA